MYELNHTCVIILYIRYVNVINKLYCAEYYMDHFSQESILLFNIHLKSSIFIFERDNHKVENTLFY